MPQYQRVGDVPPKRYTQFRSPAGTLRGGADGLRGLLVLVVAAHHRHPPTALVAAESVDGGTAPPLATCGPTSRSSPATCAPATSRRATTW